MAKRFTDNNKWKKNSFTELSLKMKLIWIYLCDECDHAGIWEINLRLLSFQIGEPTTLDEILDAFGDKVLLLHGKKLFIQSFIDFQYGTLNHKNRVHQSVLDRLKKEGACMDLVSPLQGGKDKEQDKEKDMDKAKDNMCTALSSSEKSDLRFDKDYQVFEKDVLEACGYTPSFKNKIPDIYKRWRGKENALIEFVESRIATYNKMPTKNSTEIKPWLRKALLDESGLGDK